MADHPGAALPGRRCQNCGGVVPRRTHRQRNPAGQLVCQNCAQINQPVWAGATSAALTTEEIAEMRDRMAGAQASILASRRLRAEVLDAQHQFNRRHLLEAHGWSEAAVDSSHPADLRGLHWGLHQAAEAGELAHPGHDHGAGGRVSMRREAHESADDTLVAHCPWCGSGQVVGNADGSVACGYCGRVCTIKLEPAFPAMPQGDPMGQVPMPMEAGAPEEPMPGGPVPPEEDPMAQQAFATVRGDHLDRDAYLRHLALRHAEDPAAVLATITAAGGAA